MKYKSNYLTWPALLFCLLLASCDKYLDVVPKGKTLLTNVSDFELWMNSKVTYEISGIPQICWMTDHAQKLPWDPAFIGENERAYLWAEQFTEPNYPPQMLAGAYRHIYLYNTVINNIDAAAGGTPEQKASLKAEALLARANEYFYLMNLYGKPYDAATAATDPAVPFVTASDIHVATPPRMSVQGVYDQIIADINDALPHLPEDNSDNRFRGSKHAAYSVLARIYFYMRNYSEAAAYAELALQRPGGAEVTDYNGLVKNFFPRDTRINEMIFARGSDPNSGTSVAIGDSAFIKSYPSTDLRPALYYYDGPYYPFNYNTIKPSAGVRFGALSYDVQVGTTVAEMKLILAEYAVRNDDVETALQHLNEIRIKRFAPADYQPLSSTDPEEVFEWVIRERRHEMPFNGLRWFDMRRLDSENRMPEIKRYDREGNVLATLPPHSVRYTLQIPVNALIYNPDMDQNP